METKQRYFIVFYTAFTEEGFALCNGTSIGKSYPSHNKFSRDIMNANRSYKKVVINNIIELPKEDFESWNS